MRKTGGRPRRDEAEEEDDAAGEEFDADEVFSDEDVRVESAREGGKSLLKLVGSFARRTW